MSKRSSERRKEDKEWERRRKEAQQEVIEERSKTLRELRAGTRAEISDFYDEENGSASEYMWFHYRWKRCGPIVELDPYSPIGVYDGPEFPFDLLLIGTTMEEVTELCRASYLRAKAKAEAVATK